MTIGSGAYLAPGETDQKRQNQVIRQLLEGRSNAVGFFTLSSSSTSGTVVTATCCTTSSTIQITPITANAAWEMGIAYVTPGIGSFTVTHSTNGSTARDFTYAIQG